MNQWQLFQATMEHREHESWLYYLSFTPNLEKAFLKHTGLPDMEAVREHFGIWQERFVQPRQAKEPDKPDFSRYYSDVKIPDDAYIDSLGVLHVPGSMYHFTHYISPLRHATSLSEMEDFPWPSQEAYTQENGIAEVEQAHAEGLSTVCGIGHMYEDAWQIRGYEEFLMDMPAAPEICEYILDRLFERNMKKAVWAARAGVDRLLCGDDVANQKTMMFSVDSWRHFMKSRWQKEIKPDIRVWYHSDGNIMEIIPDLIEAGVDILNPVQPECLNVAEVKQRFGDRLVLDGTIGTQSVMPFGSPDDVRQTVREMKRTVGYDGALILSPTHILEPEVPIDNILAFLEECARPAS